MPFKSNAQRRFMWKEHPEIARRWAKTYGSKPLSKHVIKKRLKRKVKRG